MLGVTAVYSDDLSPCESFPNFCSISAGHSPPMPCTGVGVAVGTPHLLRPSAADK